MSVSVVESVGPGKLSILLPSGGRSYMYSSARIYRSLVNDSICYVIDSEQGARVVLVASDDLESQGVLDALPTRDKPDLVKRMLQKEVDVDPATYLGPLIEGSLQYDGTVVAIQAGPERWYFVPDRERTPQVVDLSSSTDRCEVRLLMPDGRQLRLGITEPILDEALRAIAVLRTALQPGQSVAGGPRWQHGVVNLGMYGAMDRMVSVLSTLGRDGWELVNVYDKASNWMQGMEKGFMLFKRPVPPGVTLGFSDWCLRLDRKDVAS
jgi:hypothetical protein